MQFFDPADPKIQERVVFQSSLAFALVTYMPIVPGHVIVCPIRPVATSEELLDEEWRAILQIKKKVCDSLKIVFGAEGFNFAWNAGEMAGQSVPHFHLHIVPRKKGDQGIYHYEPRSFLYRPGNRELSPQQELREVAILIKNKLSE